MQTGHSHTHIVCLWVLKNRVTPSLAMHLDHVRVSLMELQDAAKLHYF